MIGTSVHITISEEWANIYSWLKYFNEYYDNADQEIQIVLNAIVEEFIKEEQLRNHPLTKDEAVSFLSTIPRNTRNAGRAHKFSAEKLQAMSELLLSGVAKKDIASQFNCSISYLEKLHHGLRHRV